MILCIAQLHCRQSAQPPLPRLHGCGWVRLLLGPLLFPLHVLQRVGCIWPQVAEHPGKWRPGAGGRLGTARLPAAPSGSQSCQRGHCCSLSSAFLGVGFIWQGWSSLSLACRADCMHSTSVLGDVLSQLESGPGGGYLHPGNPQTPPISTFFSVRGRGGIAAHDWLPARSGGALRGGKGATGFFVFVPERERGSDRGREGGSLSPDRGTRSAFRPH